MDPTSARLHSKEGNQELLANQVAQTESTGMDSPECQQRRPLRGIAGFAVVHEDQSPYRLSITMDTVDTTKKMLVEIPGGASENGLSEYRLFNMNSDDLARKIEITDVEVPAGTTCAGCQQPIEDAVARLMAGSHWHGGCLVCWHCPRMLRKYCLKYGDKLCCDLDYVITTVISCQSEPDGSTVELSSESEAADAILMLHTIDWDADGQNKDGSSAESEDDCPKAQSRSSGRDDAGYVGPSLYVMPTTDVVESDGNPAAAETVAATNSNASVLEDYAELSAQLSPFLGIAEVQGIESSLIGLDLMEGYDFHEVVGMILNESEGTLQPAPSPTQPQDPQEGIDLLMEASADVAAPSVPCAYEDLLPGSGAVSDIYESSSASVSRESVDPSASAAVQPLSGELWTPLPTEPHASVPTVLGLPGRLPPGLLEAAAGDRSQRQPASACVQERSKQRRKVMTATQTAILESGYRNRSRPSKQEKLQLAQLTGLALHSVQAWFQNRRKKDKVPNTRSDTNFQSWNHHLGWNTPDFASPFNNPGVMRPPGRTWAGPGNPIPAFNPLPSLPNQGYGPSYFNTCDVPSWRQSAPGNLNMPVNGRQLQGNPGQFDFEPKPGSLNSMMYQSNTGSNMHLPQRRGVQTPDYFYGPPSGYGMQMDFNHHHPQLLQQMVPGPPPPPGIYNSFSQHFETQNAQPAMYHTPCYQQQSVQTNMMMNVRGNDGQGYSAANPMSRSYYDATAQGTVYPGQEAFGSGMFDATAERRGPLGN